MIERGRVRIYPIPTASVVLSANATQVITKLIKKKKKKRY